MLLYVKGKLSEDQAEPLLPLNHWCDSHWMLVCLSGASYHALGSQRPQLVTDAIVVECYRVKCSNWWVVYLRMKCVCVLSCQGRAVRGSSGAAACTAATVNHQLCGWTSHRLDAALHRCKLIIVIIISASLSMSIASVRSILTEHLSIPSVGLCVCVSLSGKCTVAKWVDPDAVGDGEWDRLRNGCLRWRWWLLKGKGKFWVNLGVPL